MAPKPYPLVTIRVVVLAVAGVVCFAVSATHGYVDSGVFVNLVAEIAGLVLLAGAALSLLGNWWTRRVLRRRAGSQ